MEAQSPMVSSRVHKYADESGATGTSSTPAEAVAAPVDSTPPRRKPAGDSDVWRDSPVAAPSRRKVSGPVVFDALKSTPVQDPSQVSAAGFTVQVSDWQVGEVKQRAEGRLMALYPKTRGRVSKSHFVPPSLGGRLLSNNSSKYLSPLTSQSEIEVND